MHFVNREKEIKYLNDYFDSEPNSLLFVYGPKSSGKSRLLEKTARDLDAQKYAVNFLDLRQVVIYDFKTFLNIFFPKKLRNKAKDILNGFTINTGFFSVKMDEESVLEENAFKVIIDKLESAKQRRIQPILIIDEIQLLKHIHINDERYLLTELFNLFIALTKVRNTAHIVLATSDSYFIEKIYGSARLAKTSEFLLLDHFEETTVYNWLEKENFKKEEIQTVWDLLGGCPWEVRQVIRKKNKGGKVKEVCETLITDSYGKIFEFARTLKEKEINIFEKVIKDIVNKGFFQIKFKDDSRELLDGVLKKAVELDIWFYAAEQHRITANSKSVFIGFERLLKEIPN